ncbi:hypothetical protein L198_07894 [Cryptococcus wingfieldii CBS 7118]|uniref:PAZ domain-containing protein n=1 Tax=Cryptococcus wingfieldii CBS 7118 TaxID=1295528 RepID=A0A1E3HUS7_9TREE|nr:hypothetical protein L198_07894 [Cryptococcus wingfieldii CBS 7118]ODN80084.1 hypothetical protein L198_07894 [Cryptococcus wingfieldii CBS 7118]
MLTDVVPKLLGFAGGGGRGGRGGRGGFVGGPPPGAARSLQVLDPPQTTRLNDILRGAKFTVTHQNTERVFVIIKLTVKAADEIKFTLNGKDGQPDRTVSVAQYFQEQYNVRVTRPRLPCVQYGKNCRGRHRWREGWGPLQKSQHYKERITMKARYLFTL